jgi:ribosomal protein L37AE/L43A
MDQPACPHCGHTVAAEALAPPFSCSECGNPIAGATEADSRVARQFRRLAAARLSETVRAARQLGGRQRPPRSTS